MEFYDLKILKKKGERKNDLLQPMNEYKTIGFLLMGKLKLRE